MDEVEAAIRRAVENEREACARLAESYGVVGWLVYKDQWTVQVAHDTQRIIARAIRDRG